MIHQKATIKQFVYIFRTVHSLLCTKEGTSTWKWIEYLRKNRNENWNPIQIADMSVLCTVRLARSYEKTQVTKTRISTGFKPLDNLRASFCNTSACFKEAISVFGSPYLKCTILVFHVWNQKYVHWQERWCDESNGQRKNCCDGRNHFTFPPTLILAHINPAEN